jgi:hypothetical protein
MAQKTINFDFTFIPKETYDIKEGVIIHKQLMAGDLIINLDNPIAIKYPVHEICTITSETGEINQKALYRRALYSPRDQQLGIYINGELKLLN